MSDGKVLLPKFLTKEIALDAIYKAKDTFRSLLVANSTNRMFHVVVLVPTIQNVLTSGSPYWSDYQIRAHTLAELSFGDPAEWSHNFAYIARYKALQLWMDRNDGSTDIKPHLLFEGDTPYWGGIKRDGIVVSCSGLEPWLDRMVAGITADICIALAYDNFKKWKAEHPNAEVV